MLNRDLSWLLSCGFRFGFTAVLRRRLRPDVTSDLKLELRTEFRCVLKPVLTCEVRPVLKSRLKSDLNAEFTPGVTRPFPDRLL